MPLFATMECRIVGGLRSPAIPPVAAGQLLYRGLSQEAHAPLRRRECVGLTKG